MNPSAILYIGSNSGTSGHRASALKRLANDVVTIDPTVYLPKGRFVDAWTWHSGGLFLESFVRHKVLAEIRGQEFDLVYVDCGELVGPSLVSELKNRFGTVVNYNIDDPYGQRDGRRWRLYHRALPLYDLVVVVRECNVSEALARGARNIMRVYMSADEIAHAARPITEDHHRQWAMDVAFIGTWMPERGPFMARLVDLGVPLSIYGDRWQKAPEWTVLHSCWRGGGLYGDDYARAIQCAKVSVGMLSKGNRDLTTTRSFEIPYLGGVLCAERTVEHAQLYREDQEAVFWSTPDECASKCMRLLQDEQYRKSVAIKGRNRCLHNNTTNEAVLAQILYKALQPEQSTVDALEPQPLTCPVLTPVLSEAYRV